MFRYLFTLLILASALFLTGCSQSQSSTEELAQVDLIDLMTGSYNSKKQSEADSAYYDISLHMYPIWTSREGNWLYVEQALASTPDEPYRQRVYKLEDQENGSVKSIIYTLDDEERFIGKWESPEFFSQFTAKSLLTEREGCAVLMKRIDADTFEGSTQGKDCLSTLRGAAYATSKVKITASLVESWDQGFDDSNEQVWGAVKGGYIFDKFDK